MVRNSILFPVQHTELGPDLLGIALNMLWITIRIHKVVSTVKNVYGFVNMSNKPYVHACI